MNPSLPLDTESFLAEADTDTFLFSRLYIQVSLIYKCSVTSDGWIKSYTSIKNQPKGASLVAQWLRICLLMQETQVRALVWEDPTCHGAAGPVSHSC